MMMSPGSEAGEDIDMDPRVKTELETLNFASTEINKLEREIDMARNKFRSLLSESSTRLNSLHKKLGKCVDKARSYYESLKQFKQAESDLTKATLRFQRANSLYQAAKETVALAEERMTTCSREEKLEFDSAWQEMMNHATLRFSESEKEKRSSEEQHQQIAGEYSAAQQKLKAVEKDIPRSINRSKPYFELKDHLEGRLQAERQSVEDLQRALTAAKETYGESLKNLETISEEIHAKRKLSSLPVRTPGVGAEAGDLQADMMSINLDTESMCSEAFPDESDVASLSSQDAALILDSSPSPTDPLGARFSATDSLRVVSPISPTAAKSGFLTPKHATSSQAFTSEPVNSKSSGSGSCSEMETVDTCGSGGLDGDVSGGGINRQFPVMSDPLRSAAASNTEISPDNSTASPKNRIKKFLPDNPATNTSAASCNIPAVTQSTTSSSITHSTNLGMSPSAGRNISKKSPNSDLRETSSVTSSADESADSASLQSDLSFDSAVHQQCKSPESQIDGTPSRGRPKDRRVQKLNPSNFPILQYLSDTNKRMSPKLPHGRPKGQEMVFHHSPSPVRKANSGYYVYPEPRLRSKSGVAREVSPGPNLFPDSDTSLFERKVAGNIECNHSTNNTKVETSKDRLDSIQTFDAEHKVKSEVTVMGKELPAKVNSMTLEVTGKNSNSNGNQNRDGAVKNEVLNINQSNNSCLDQVSDPDGYTADGKFFYNL